MQSFLLKTISFILVINVNFSRSCYSSVCLASCYWSNKGFDYGYCIRGECKCSPPVVYLYDGIGYDLSDNDIQNSLSNDNVIQNTISIQNQKSPSPLNNEITETVTETEIKTNTVNQNRALSRRLKGQIIPEPADTISKTIPNYNNKQSINIVENKQIKNVPNISDQKLKKNSEVNINNYEVRRNSKKTVTHEEEEENKVHEVTVQYSIEYKTAEDTSETSEEEDDDDEVHEIPQTKKNNVSPKSRLSSVK